MSGHVRYAGRAGEFFNSRLGLLDLELTERCNNDCVHCCINLPASDAAAQVREMTTGQVEAVLRQAADLGCLQVRLTGGEPLLRHDFEDIYRCARGLGMEVVLFTNACLLTARTANLFARVPPLAPLEITVYGMRRESYEAVTRTRGSFAAFRRGVDLLLEREVPFIVKGALLPANRDEMDDFDAWAATLPWMSRPPSYIVLLDLRSRRDDPQKNRLIESMRTSPEESVQALLGDEAGYREGMAEFAERFMGTTGACLFGCGAGRDICVDSYGRAQPCMGLRARELTFDALKIPMGSIIDRFARLSDMRAEDPEYLRRCAVCFLRGFCEQCPAKSWVEHGALDRPVDYFCEVAHAQARWLGWLEPGERGWEVTDRHGRSDRERVVADYTRQEGC